MDILFGLIGLLFLLAMLVGGLVIMIFIAKKIGLIKTAESSATGIQSHLTDLKQLNNHLAFRFGLIILLVGLMNIPLTMVSDVVDDRSWAYNNVLSDIASTWGEQQKLQGPVLLIPYTEKLISEKVLTDKDGVERKVNKTTYQHHTAIILPEDLNIDADLASDTRNRGIYNSLVYTADLNITGSFQRPDISHLSNNIDEIHWDQAWLSLGISDTQAINKVSSLQWQNNQHDVMYLDFEPSTKIISTIPQGFHAPLDLSQDSLSEDITIYSFSLDIDVNGSNGFYFSPFGKVSNIHINSDWPHPSFQGNALPDQYTIEDSGFDAYWSIPNLARNYPQMWTLETQQFDLDEFSAGVNLFESVSLYSKITRAIKYGSLFFILTYITFLIFEMAIGRRLHLVQYGMIGLALSMFYLALLSLAEHIGFFTAYLSAASVIISMISLYVYAAIRRFSSAAIIGTLLSGLYVILYMLLKSEDHALVSGTALLLVVLAIMMYLTRNIGTDKV